MWYDFDSIRVPVGVSDLTVWDNHAIVAGAGDFPVKSMSVRWWDVGSDAFDDAPLTSPTVFGLGEFQGNLIACGAFESIGSATVNSVASWNGTTWSPLGAGITDGHAAYCLTAENDKLYMGGQFVTTSGDTVNNVAVWSLE